MNRNLLTPSKRLFAIVYSNSFSLLLTLVLVLNFGNIAKINAQCIGPYQGFESIGVPGATAAISRQAMIDKGWSFSIATVTPANSATNSRTGSNFLNIGGYVLGTDNSIITPVIANPKIFQFYFRSSIATRDVNFIVEWFNSDLSTRLGFQDRVTNGTTYTSYSRDLSAFTNVRVKVTLTGVTVGTGTPAMFIDDISWTSTINSQNIIVVPELLNSICSSVTVPAAGSGVLKFYDQGGLSDNYSTPRTYISAATASSVGTTVTGVSTANLVVGMYLIVQSGTGAFAPGTTVTSIDSPTTFTVSVAPTTQLAAATVFGTLATTPYISGGASSIGTTVTVATTANLVVGMSIARVSGTGLFAAGTTVTSIIDGTSFTVSVTPTTALIGAVVRGAPPQTQIVVFKPDIPTDKVRLTFVNSFALDALANITVYNGNGAIAGNEFVNANAYTNTSALPGGTQSPLNSFTSTDPSGFITVKFVSSILTPLSGFEINVECPESLAITSLGTTSGCSGDPLVINGTGFTGAVATNIKVGGTPVVSSIVSNAGTVLTVIPAPNSTGAVSVTIGNTVSFGAYTVNPLPTATANSSGSTCAGNPLSLIGGASGGSGSGYSYSWSGPDSFTNATQSPLVSNIATTAMTGTYSLIVTDSNLCSSTAVTTAVTIIAPPTTSTNGGNITTCRGNTTPGLQGNTPTVGTGLWTCTGAPAGGNTSAITFNTATTPNATALVAAGAVAGAYTLTWTISNAGCTPSSSSLTLTVNAPPTTSINGGNKSACIGTTTSALGGNTPTIGSGLWTCTIAPTGGSTSDISFTSASTGDTTAIVSPTATAGNYILRWTISNTVCTSSISVLTLTIVAPPTTSSNGGNKSACTGSVSPALGGSAAAVGTGLWTCTGAPAGGNTSAITFTSASTADTTAIVAAGAVAGAYTLTWTISNAGCSSSSSSLILTVIESPTITSVAMGGQGTCLNGPLTQLSISATAGSGSISSYQWYSNTTASTTVGTTVGTNSNTFAPPNNAIGTLYYYCVVTNTAGCPATSAVSGAIVVSSSPPAASVANPASLIGGSTFTANWSAVSGATNYFLDVSTVNTFASYVTGYNNLSVGNVTSFPVAGLSQGATYYYRVRVFNGCFTSVNSTTRSVTLPTLTYCDATYSSGGITDQITNVTLGALNNTSNSTFVNNTFPYYTFFNTVTIPNIYQNSTTTISVSFGTDRTQFLGVWIDYNQNGTFEASEGVVSVNPVGASGTAVLTLTIPSGALLGNTRMRVRGGDDAAMTTAMACGATNSIWGQTEDYIVNIISVPPCSVSLPTNITASFVTGTTALISWTDTSFAPSSIYQYGVSATNTIPPTSLATITGATSINLTGLTPLTNYYFWVRTNCGGSNQSAWAVSSSTFYTLPFDFVILNSSTTGLTTTGCNARFFDSGGGAANYLPSENFSHTFTPDVAGSRMKAVFNSFVLTSGDFLEVYSGPTVAAANLIGRYTGTQIATGQSFFSTATGGALTFLFISDSGIFNDAGWDVSLSCVTVPRIDGFTPTDACAGTTPEITINGVNFTGATTVSFNGVTAIPSFVSATQIKVNLPPAATTGSISVTSSETGTSATAFTVKPVPTTPNAGADTFVCNPGGSVDLNANGSMPNILVNNCSSLSDWITNDAIRWTSQNTNMAGGSAAGELNFFYSTSGVTDSFIYLKQLINTTGYTSLNLSFRHMLDDFGGNSNIYNLSVETSQDLSSWTPRWNIATTADISATNVNVDLSPLNGTSFYIRFRFVGNAFDIDNWYVDDVILSGAPQLSYSWSTSPTMTPVIASTQLVSVSSPGSYYVTTSLNGCTSVTDQVVVAVNSRPTSVLSMLQPSCNGNPARLRIALTGTGPWILSYTDGTTPVTVPGITASPYEFLTPSITGARTYTVTALTDSKCSALAADMTGSPVITTSAAPTITLPTTAAAAVCYSGSIQTTTLAYDAITGPPVTYSVVWGAGYVPAGYASVTDATFPTASSGAISINVPPGADNQVLNTATLTLKNAQGCVSASYPFTLIVNRSPQISILTAPITICYSAASQSVSYSYTTSNNTSAYDVTWASPSNGLPTILNASAGSSGDINITVPAGTPGGTYTGTVTPKNAGCLPGGPKTIILIISQPSITPSDVTVCITAGAQTTTTLAYSNPTGITSNTTYNISWNSSPSNSFVAVTDATLSGSPLTIDIPAGTAANTYTGFISVKNDNTCVSPGYSFNVVVNNKPEMTSSFVLQTVCPSVDAQTAVLSYSAVSNAATYTIDWTGLADQLSTSDAFVSGNINNIIVPAGLPVNQYSGTINLTSTSGCLNSYPITMNVGKRWSGTTDSNWATPTNWIPSGVPVSSDCVIIPSGTPNPVITSNANCGNLTINSGATLTVDPVVSGIALTVQDFVKTEGTLTINNGASLIQVNDVSNSGLGVMNYYRDVSSLQGFDYIYWSSPVLNQPISGLYTSPDPGFRYYWDTLINNGNGGQGNWVAATGAMEVGKGYIMRASSSYGWTGSLTATFTGIPNNGTIPVTVKRGSYDLAAGYNGVNTSLITRDDDNYNLIGNPYPSAIDADDFLTENASKIKGFVKLWTHGLAPTSSTNPFYGSFAFNYADDYLTYNKSGPSDPIGFDGKIAAGQGFFVVMNDGTTDTQQVVFTNTIRNADNSQFYRTNSVSSTTEEKNRIWLDLVDANSNATSNLVAYVQNATNGVDRMYDAITKVDSNNSIYSTIENQKYIIQGRSLPFDVNDLVPIGYKAINSGIYKIAISAVDGLFQNGQSIYLEDKLLNVIHDLRSAPYSFATETGTFEDRFVLRYTAGALGVPVFTENTVVVYKNETGLTINTGTIPMKSVAIYDVTGRLITSQKEIYATQTRFTTLPSTNQVLLVEITSETGVKITKKVVY